MLMIKALCSLSKTVRDLATQEMLDEEGTRQKLRELYMLLERGDISEDQFEEREVELVERLEEIETYNESRA